IENAIEPIIDKLQGFDRQFAKKALQVYGKDAEKYLIPRLFDKNNEIRQEVQALLKEIGTPTDKLVPEAIKAAGDRDLQQAALDYLSQAKPADTYRADVMQKLEGAVDNPGVRSSMLKALEVWAGKDQVPLLLKWLESDTLPRRDLIKILGKLKDERAIEPIGKYIKQERKEALAALRDIGPKSEKVLTPLLTDADKKLVADVRKTLQDLGLKTEV